MLSPVHSTGQKGISQWVFADHFAAKHQQSQGLPGQAELPSPAAEVCCFPLLPHTSCSTLSLCAQV